MGCILWVIGIIISIIAITPLLAVCWGGFAIITTLFTNVYYHFKGVEDKANRDQWGIFGETNFREDWLKVIDKKELFAHSFNDQFINMWGWGDRESHQKIKEKYGVCLCPCSHTFPYSNHKFCPKCGISRDSILFHYITQEFYDNQTKIVEKSICDCSHVFIDAEDFCPDCGNSRKVDLNGDTPRNPS